MSGGKFVKILKKLWWFIWEDNSIWSWIANVILAFILIKFIVYPLLGLLLSTSHPIVAVVSGSMEHKYSPQMGPDGSYIKSSDGNILYILCNDSALIPPRAVNFKKSTDFEEFWAKCGAWYEAKGIAKGQFAEFPFKNGFNKGDIIFLRGKNPSDIEVGEVIVFAANKPDPIIHRVVAKQASSDGIHFQTKGDHNPGFAVVNEDDIHQDRVIGKALFRVPFVGYVKIAFVSLINLFKG